MLCLRNCPPNLPVGAPMQQFAFLFFFLFLSLLPQINHPKCPKIQPPSVFYLQPLQALLFFLPCLAWGVQTPQFRENTAPWEERLGSLSGPVPDQAIYGNFIETHYIPSPILCLLRKKKTLKWFGHKIY